MKTIFLFALSFFVGLCGIEILAAPAGSGVADGTARTSQSLELEVERAKQEMDQAGQLYEKYRQQATAINQRLAGLPANHPQRAQLISLQSQAAAAVEQAQTQYEVKTNEYQVLGNKAVPVMEGLNYIRAAVAEVNEATKVPTGALTPQGNRILLERSKEISEAIQQLKKACEGDGAEKLQQSCKELANLERQAAILEKTAKQNDQTRSDLLASAKSMLNGGNVSDADKSKLGALLNTLENPNATPEQAEKAIKDLYGSKNQGVADLVSGKQNCPYCVGLHDYRNANGKTLEEQMGDIKRSYAAPDENLAAAKAANDKTSAMLNAPAKPSTPKNSEPDPNRFGAVDQSFKGKPGADGAQSGKTPEEVAAATDFAKRNDFAGDNFRDQYGNASTTAAGPDKASPAQGTDAPDATQEAAPDAGKVEAPAATAATAEPMPDKYNEVPTDPKSQEQWIRDGKKEGGWQEEGRRLALAKGLQEYQTNQADKRLQAEAAANAERIHAERQRMDEATLAKQHPWWKRTFVCPIFGCGPSQADIERQRRWDLQQQQWERQKVVQQQQIRSGMEVPVVPPPRYPSGEQGGMQGPGSVRILNPSPSAAPPVPVSKKKTIGKTKAIRQQRAVTQVALGEVKGEGDQRVNETICENGGIYTSQADVNDFTKNNNLPEMTVREYSDVLDTCNNSY